MTNTELVIETIKAHPHNQFSRYDVFKKADAAKMSPYFSCLMWAGLLTKSRRGMYIKTADFDSTPTAELLTKALDAAHKRRAEYRSTAEHSVDGTPKKQVVTAAADQPVEVDLFEVLDQVPIESIFDLLAAKFNVLQGQKLPMTYELDRLREQLQVQVTKSRNLEAEVARLEERQRALNVENTRLTALMSNRREERIVLAKPVNASGSVVFKDGGERRTVKVYRKV